LSKARAVLDQNGTFEDAFGQLTLLEDRFKGLIATGSTSGRLDEMLDKLVALVTEQLEFTLQAFNNVFQRIVAFCVAMSIVETITICTLL
jgi:type II secretory pathway component PulF